ncbi:pirin family protein [Granulicoccus sp. GXG6511]|uniref:pirin family protein n=1 Tax=Granulicoccus sp. GXG6511 TaxID=3381351 RepID=UPI003D7D6548
MVTELITPREVPLGGLRAMTVRRTLPTRERSLIGAWCFLDHYGPDRVAETGGMQVARHPHTGLATVSWLFTGAVDHLDSAGNSARVVPGELNLMTAGRGITHSEFSTEDTETLYGVQLWFALPDSHRHGDPGFDHYRPEPIAIDGGEILVFLGSLAGSTSPVETATELVGAELRLQPGAQLTLAVDPRHEHGVLVDTGSAALGEVQLAEGELGFAAAGSGTLEIAAGEHGARLVLIGGEPFGEQIVMWWNFIGRTHDEVAEYRDAYQHEITTGEPGRFGPWPDGTPDPIPAPPMPNMRLRPRG